MSRPQGGGFTVDVMVSTVLIRITVLRRSARECFSRGLTRQSFALRHVAGPYL